MSSHRQQEGREEVEQVVGAYFFIIQKKLFSCVQKARICILVENLNDVQEDDNKRP